MLSTKAIRMGTASTLISAAACVVPVAMAEVSASVGVASSYLWRGLDLGSGTPAVWGDLAYSQGGAYGGIWGSSGDTTAGTEYDLYAGYAVSFGTDDMFSLDVSLWSYQYPTGPGPVGLIGGLQAEPDLATGGYGVQVPPNDPVRVGQLSELIVALGAGPVTFAYYDNVAGATGYEYYTLSGDLGALALTVGMHNNPEGNDPVHVNLDYAYNDNLTFTLSQFVADEPEGDDLKFVVAYSIPLGE